MTFAWVALILCLALAITFISIFFKNPLINLMGICAWCGVIFTNEYEWIQIVAVIGAIMMGLSFMMKFIRGDYD